MPISQLQPSNLLGLGGQTPQFRIIPGGTHHKMYSVNGTPQIYKVGVGLIGAIPRPSRLEEGDPSNTNKFKNRPGQTYI